MKNKGFSLIELLAVLVLLAIIATISLPGIVGTLNTSKEKAYESQKKIIEDATRRWITDNPLAYDEEKRKVNKEDPTDKRIKIYVDELQDEGYLNLNKQILNPKTKEPMDGCVVINEDDEYKQYTYEYKEKTDELCQQEEPEENSND